MGNGITDTLAQFVVDLRYEDIPPAVIQHTKECMIDSLGCALGGSVTKLGRAFLEGILEFKGSPMATVFGHCSRLAPHQAATVNTAFSNLLDFDDNYEGIGHPGDNIIPPALSVGEANRISGKDLLLAIVAGYEVSGRVGYGIKPKSPERIKAIYPIACWETFGAVTGASKILGLDKNQVCIAFGIAGDTAPVPTSLAKGAESPLGWNKIGMAYGSGNGVLAAYLSRQGVACGQSIFDGDGFWLQAGSDNCDPKVMTAGLGKDFLILTTSYKPYPSVAWFHSANDALSNILSHKSVKTENIAQINVTTLFQAARAQNMNPQTMIDGEFSLPYGVAMVALGVPAGPTWFTNEVMHSQKTRAMLEKIKVTEDPEATKLFANSKGSIQRATVEVQTTDGKHYTEMVDYKRGSIQNPLSPKDLEDKFLQMAVPVLKDKKANELIETIHRIESLPDITTLVDLLRPEK